MWRAENGKKPMPMIRFPVSCNLSSQIWHFEKIWCGLSASGGLFQKIYDVDPLKCPKCQVCMRVIAFIEYEDDYVIDADFAIVAYGYDG